MINQHPTIHAQVTQFRLRELRQRAEGAHLARQIAGSHPLRHRIGRLCVTFGQVLHGRPASAESVVDNRRLAA